VALREEVTSQAVGELAGIDLVVRAEVPTPPASCRLAATNPQIRPQHQMQYTSELS
jgi:hypothetical protein